MFCLQWEMRTVQVAIKLPHLQSTKQTLEALAEGSSAVKNANQSVATLEVGYREVILVW